MKKFVLILKKERRAGLEEFFSLGWLTALGSILVLDLILSGDNAVLIALACKNLPVHHRLKGMIIGCAGAVIIRVILTLFATELLSVAYIQFIGGIALFYIALKLLKNDDSEKKMHASDNLAGAVKTIMLADFIMSLDNVLSMAGVANTVPDSKWSLILCGLLISLPIVICGAQLFLVIMKKIPLMVYLGSAILAFTSAKMILLDKAVGSELLWLNGWLEAIFIIAVFLWGGYKAKISR
ncbi:YjbE family putative metal transport protein [Pectinatus haikarae]|uniref:YjbE family integral membrane protein n=1 Tax=Pectinatus haikarae TaxID=349096 RepID=A0ABT9Y5Q6_9FIRM|nr:YjbE family putative metal transport protein [Pectinatus haikarae]MDQ0203166.1 YjbE family integral membrane protein [Pectinatus haikarae]